MNGPSAASTRRITAWCVAAVLGLFVVQLVGTWWNAGRQVGVVLDETERGLYIDGVTPDGAAARAGLRVGDRLLQVDDRPVEGFDDYDRLAEGFSRGQPARFRIVRGDVIRSLSVLPGAPLPLGRMLMVAVAIAALLALAWLASRQTTDLRARLLVAMLLLVAVELALPLDVFGLPAIGWSSLALAAALSGAQMAVELHLVSLIPARPRFLRDRPWLVPLVYWVGGVLGGSAAIVLVATSFGGIDPERLPIDPVALLYDVGLPSWALLVVVLLVRTLLTHADGRGRAQAGLILVGVMPWVLLMLVELLVLRFDLDPAFDLEALFPLTQIVYAGAAFVAIARYRLFDLQMVLRRSLVYTILTAAVMLLFYATLGIGVAVASGLLEGLADPLWLISGSTLLLGLLFGPLHRWLESWIDRRVFPERHVRRQRLVELARALPAQGSLSGIADRLTSELDTLFGVRLVTLLVPDRQESLLRPPPSGADASEAGSDALEILRRDPGIVRLARVGRPLTDRQIEAVSPGLRSWMAEHGAALLVPLLVQDSLVGVLVLGRRDEAFTSEERDLIRLFAQHAAIVIENVRLFESATFEGLTGLLRREAVLEVLDREIERARRYRRPLAVALADLDHFKAVNDRYGHPTGDLVLRAVASELRAVLRKTDAIGRYGGEEFLLVFPETTAEQAAMVAEDLRLRIAALVVEAQDGARVRVRVSIGLADIGQIEGETDQVAQALIAVADRALYQAKQSGRDQVASGRVEASVVQAVRRQSMVLPPPTRD